MELIFKEENATIFLQFHRPYLDVAGIHTM
jgi:hypothetical protein